MLFQNQKRKKQKISHRKKLQSKKKRKPLPRKELNSKVEFICYADTLIVGRRFESVVHVSSSVACVRELVISEIFDGIRVNLIFVATLQRCC